jgi:spermidine synthase
MAWTLLDRADLDGRPLELYGDGAEMMIRIDGLELMNGRWHRSEDELGRLAAALVTAGDPRILLGGLGLGHTLASLWRALGGRGRVTVAEISPAVIGWFRRHVATRLFGPLPQGIEIVEADVAALIRAGGPWDAVVLDVDNGPRPASRAANAGLYGPEGLAALAACLDGAGVLLLWSAAPEPGFAAIAEGLGWRVECLQLATAGRQDILHHLYLLSPPSRVTAHQTAKRRSARGGR